jgi:NTP pyrophosphatase (non-canonical NTP hydrolase)
LTFAQLTAANLSRVQRWHPEKGLADWSPLEWAGAMAGEAGEACNAAKKLKRIDIGTANINTEPGRSLTDRQRACKQVAKEVADTVIYGALLVAAVGEDLGAAVIEVFNRKSEEYGFPERLSEQPESAALLTRVRELEQARDKAQAQVIENLKYLDYALESRNKFKAALEARDATDRKRV